LVGGETFDRASVFTRGKQRGLPDATVAHLIGQYGSEASTIFELVDESPHLAQTVHPHHAAIGAEVIHAVRNEYARRLDDVLYRRLSIAYETADRGIAATESVAQLVGRELGWDEPRRREEIERYHDLILALPRAVR
jgi:glycerol-3-phosphate dehydrogenase